MSDSAARPTAASPNLEEIFSLEELLPTLLGVSLTGVIFFNPIYQTGTEKIIDLAYVKLNAAAQRMLQLPERPDKTFLQLYPHTLETNIFAFYRDTFLSGKPGRFDVNYQKDGLDNYFQLAAQRCGQGLVVSFSDTSDQDRTAVEEALRESQAREQAARADAEAQRQRLHDILMQLPARVATNRGPNHVYDLVNPLYQQLFPKRTIQGRPVREALPELEGQQYFELLDQVYQTGEPFYGNEMETWIDFTNTGRLDKGYFNVFFQATRDAHGRIDGLLNFAYDVTEQVVARQQAEQSRQQVLNLNEELATANQELIAARAEAELQRQQLHHIFMQAPALICIFEGPNHVFKLVNPPYQQLVGDRPLLGKPIAEALPELVGQPIFGLLDKVYRTGESFHANEMLVQLDHDNSGDLGQNYYNFIYQANRDLNGVIDGILMFAYEVTAQIRTRRQVEYSRQQVQDLNEELHAVNEELQTLNEELRVTNEELLTTNNELLSTQQSLQQLNAELEFRVAKRTQEVQRAQAETERQRQRLERFFMEAPAAICIHSGPDLTYELVNLAYRKLFQDRQLLGKPVLTVLPELTNSTTWHTLQRVYQTGQTHEEYGILVPVRRPEDGILEDRYFNYIQQARFNEHGQVDGILVFAFEVTEQVKARQRADALQAEVLTAAQRLVQERETFYQVFEQTPASIALLRGPEHRVEYYNQAYQQLFPGRSMRGRTIAEMQPEAVEQGFVALLDKVYQTGETFYGNELLLAIEQEKGTTPKDIYFNFTYQVYREQEQIVGISVFAYDVSEQVIARRQREVQQQQLRKLFEQAPVAIGLFAGPEYIVDICNPGLQAIWGRTLEQVLHKPLFEVLPETRDQGFQELLDEVMRTGVPYVAHETPLQIIHRGQLTTVHVNFVYHPLRDKQDLITAIVVVATDVTEQVASRQAIEANAQQLRLITDALPVLISYLDKEEKYRFVNQAYEAWFHQKPENLLGRHVREVIGEKAYQNVKSYMKRALAGERLDYEALVPYREDFIRYIHTSYVPDTREGEVAGFYAMVTDITEQVEARKAVEESEQQATALAEELARANKELQEANQQLTRTNVDLDNFIYTASHDLKAPILNIEGLMDALLDQLSPESLQLKSVQRTTDLILDSVQRFKRTIDHLTEITKLQKENNPETAAVDLATVIAEVQLDLAPAVQATQAQIIVDVTSCPTIRFSEKNLRSIIYNLLSNAIKYHAPERTPRVLITCYETFEYQVITVQDNGLGIDLTQQQKLFAMFKRLHNHVEGSGIGLYMVKKIIENVGGKIEVQSKVGEGSTFRIFLPQNSDSFYLLPK